MKPRDDRVFLQHMRDKLVHDYFGVDVGMVWITASEDLPELHKQVAEILDGQ